MQLTVLKRSGATEPFTRDKAIAGVRKACKGRPVTEDQLACLGQAVEDALRRAGAAEIPAHEVGLAILGPLRALDEVAYLRFASVYRAFESADDFEDEIAMLRAEREPASLAQPQPHRADPDRPACASGEAACAGRTNSHCRGRTDAAPMSVPAAMIDPAPTSKDGTEEMTETVSGGSQGASGHGAAG